MRQGAEKIWATMTHLGMAIVPFSGIGALIIFLMFRDRSRYIAHHAYQAMWFFFSAWIVGFVLSFVLPFRFVFGLLWLATIAMTAVASMNALAGHWYEYPVIGRVWRRALGN